MSSLRLNGLDPIALERVVEFGRRMFDDGLVLGTSGNISVRLDEAYAITPSSIPYDELTVEGLVLLDSSGRQIGGAGRPSSETPMHLAAYRATGAGAVVHTHSATAVAVSTVVDELPAVHYDIAQLGGHDVPIVGYERFGSDALAARVEGALADRSAAILRNHGTIACGADLAQAYHRARLVEWLADVYLKATSIGNPMTLDRPAIDEVMAESRRRRYGAVAA